MDKEIGISVGVRSGNTINWYRAHSLNRRKDGSMVAFALDDQRTPVVIKAKDFAGVAPGIRGFFSKELHPDIQEILNQNSSASN